MTTTTTAPADVAPAVVQPPRWRRGLRAVLAVLRRDPVFLGFAVAVTAFGWRLPHILLYVAGLLLVVLWGGNAFVRRRNRLAFFLAVALVGLGGPWLGVQLAYRGPAATPAEVNARDWTYLAAADGMPVFVNTASRSLAAVDDSGRRVWEAPFPVGARLQASLDGGFLVADAQSVRRLDSRARQVWSRPVPVSTSLVAETGDVVAARTCSDEAEGATCTWTGLDRADGSARWEVTGTPAPGWALGDANPAAPDNGSRGLGTSLFTLRAESGVVEVHDAGTGATVGEVPPGATPVLVGDSVLLVRSAGACGVTMMRGNDVAWESDLDCGSLAAVPGDQSVEPSAQNLWLEQPPESLGALVGDAWWPVPVDRAGEGPVVDLRTGAVRQADRADLELGAGVEVRVGDAGITVHDATDGTRLWSASVPDGGRTVSAQGEFVVVRRSPSLLLEQVFRPGAPPTVVEVYDARTGELRARLRGDGDVEVAGDRVLVDVDDSLPNRPSAVLVGG